MAICGKLCCAKKAFNSATVSIFALFQLELLKKLIGMEVREELLTFALESTKEIVKNYCHIKIIPEGLSYTVVRELISISG